jgi:LNR domain.
LHFSSKTNRCSGNGQCDGGIYMTHPSCFQDGGDCTTFLQLYPNCDVPDPEKVGDGICDGALYFKEACGWDGGDCQSCAAENIEWIRDGICNGGIYLSPGCNMDGGDCDECLAASRTDPKNLGDGYCDIELNTTLCGYDGGDCLGSDLCNVPIKDWL